MKAKTIVLTALLAAGCAGTPTSSGPESAPFKAVVVFQWVEPEGPKPESPPEASGGGPEDATTDATTATTTSNLKPPPVLSREEVEDAIFAGIEEGRVFSEVVPGNWPTVQAVARTQKADLIVLVLVDSFCQWDPGQAEIDSGMAALNSGLWLATGIGSWWIGDREFPTSSKIEVLWRPADPPDAVPAVLPDPSDRSARPALLNEFPRPELLSSGKYRLSLWDRARPLSYPWAYLLSIVCPPPLLPIDDRQQVGRTLEDLAVNDLVQEMARKLKGGYLGSGGGPFQFRLDRPRNGDTVDGDSVRISFRYSPERRTGSEMEIMKGLAIEMKPAGGSRYIPVRTYGKPELEQLNEKILQEQNLEEEIQGLERGVNLIRFVAQTELYRKWVTNTIAILRR